MGQVDRVVRGDRVQVGRGAGAIRPGVLVPALPADPLAGRGQAGALGHALQALGAGGRLAVHHLQPEGVVLQVQVGVGQPGQEHLAVQVFDLKAAAELCQQLVRGADRQDAPAVDGEGRGGGLPAIQGVNPCVGEQNSGHRLCVDLRLAGCGLSDCAMCAASAQDSAGCTRGQADPAGIAGRGVVRRFCPGDHIRTAGLREAGCTVPFASRCGRNLTFPGGYTTIKSRMTIQSGSVRADEYPDFCRSGRFFARSEPGARPSVTCCRTPGECKTI